MVPEIVFSLCCAIALSLSWKCFQKMKGAGMRLDLLGKGSVIRAVAFVVVATLGLGLSLLMLAAGWQLHSMPMWASLALKGVAYLILLWLAEYVIYEGAMIVSALLLRGDRTDLGSALLKARDDYSNAKVVRLAVMVFVFVLLTVFCSPLVDIVVMSVQRTTSGS